VGCLLVFEPNKNKLRDVMLLLTFPQSQIKFGKLPATFIESRSGLAAGCGSVL